MAVPLFSIIIPTRNRPELFEVALRSVLEQNYQGFEVIVIDDGSFEKHRSKYRQLVYAGQGVARLLNLEQTDHGHGPSYGRNYGAAHARGDYLCFLDDDDQWAEPRHLNRVLGVLHANTEPINLILANQRAYWNGSPVRAAVWLEDLEKTLHRKTDICGAYTVTASELLGSSAHCHLNTTIVSRSFYFNIGGLDETLRYEEDRDFYLRAIDQAKTIKFLPWIVSRHNVPDPATKQNASTSESELSRRLYQLRVFDKAVLFSRRLEVRRYAMRQRAYTLQHIATEAAHIQNLDSAAYYAWQAFVARPSLRWLATALLSSMRRLNQLHEGRPDLSH